MTSSRRLHLVAIAVTALPLFVPGAARAQEEQAIEREPVDCINVSRLQRMRIVDAQTILFYLPGDRVYRNTLHTRCPQLDRADAIKYDITASRQARLCADDIVNTDDGQICRLGEFGPITRDEANALLTRSDGDDVATTSDNVTPAATSPREAAPQSEPPTSEDRQQ